MWRDSIAAPTASTGVIARLAMVGSSGLGNGVGIDRHVVRAKSRCGDAASHPAWRPGDSVARRR